MIPARLRRVGSGIRYTDLERLQLEYWAAEGRTAEWMADRLGRRVTGVRQHLWRTGLSLNEARRGEAPWSGV